MKKIKQIIINSYLYKRIHKLYTFVLRLLANHKAIPFFFAHGGLHSIMFLVILSLVVSMCCSIKNSNVASFNQIIYIFYGDTLHNYRLNHLTFEKDMKRREDNTYNEGDIKFTYGYVKDTSVHIPKKILPINNRKYKDSCDLVSIVRYISCNNVPTINMEYRNMAPYKSSKGNTYFKKTKWVSNHERAYHILSTTNDSTHIFEQQTNAMDHVIEWGNMNPFFSFWIGIIMSPKTVLDDNSYIKIRFNDTKSYNSKQGIQNPMIVEKIIPRPTKFDINEIVFSGEELKNVIKQKGIYISGIDPIKKEKADRKNMIITVLLGTLIAILVDVFIQLILKWRKLKRGNKIKG